GAAKAGRCPASEVRVEGGVLRHARSGRQARFGQFVDAAARLPVPQKVSLKDPSRFRLIGRDGAVRKLDSADKTTGKAQFTIDIRDADMLTVVIARPPRFGGKVAGFDATQARAVAGVVDIKEVPPGVAVYANGTWPTPEGPEALRITWDDSGAEKRSSAQLIEEYRTLAQKPGSVAATRGDAEAALARADRVIGAEFVFPYLAHATMEPLDGFLRWDGQQALARLGSQLQTGDHQTIAGVLGL